MTQEEKLLLIRDLCARLPYGVKVGTTDNDGSLENVWDTLWYNTFTEDVKLIHSIEDADKIVDISEIKPYLFPLSSMTEDLKNELYTNLTELELKAITNEIEHSVVAAFEIDFYHKHHFDYQDLIEKELAIDATGLNIY